MPVVDDLKNALQRLERVLQNPVVCPAIWYENVARALLARFAGSEIELILDQTDLGERLSMLFVALRFRGRAFPLRWRMLPALGYSDFSEQKALLQPLVGLLLAGAVVTLMVDRD